MEYNLYKINNRNDKKLVLLSFILNIFVVKSMVNRELKAIPSTLEFFLSHSIARLIIKGAGTTGLLVISATNESRVSCNACICVIPVRIIIKSASFFFLRAVFFG